MPTSDMRKRINRTWAAEEKRIGAPIPAILRSLIENQMLGGIQDEESLEDFENLLPDYLKIFIIGMQNHLVDNQQKNEPRNGAERKIYQKCFDRRLRIVSFVIDKRITLHNLIKRDLKIDRRINWKKTCNDWNKTYPYDQMHLEVLKVEFYKAKSDQYLQEVYLDNKEAELKKALDPFFKDLGSFMNELGATIIRIANSLKTYLEPFEAIMSEAILAFSAYHESINNTLIELISVLNVIKNKKSMTEGR